MVNLFDKSLHYLGKKQSNVFVMNIGAMDGVLFDEMIGYSNMYNFKGLYVEPIPYLFEKLKTNIGGDNLFENSAISNYDGEIEMIMIKKEVIDDGLVHNCFYGMSAIYPPKNGLGSEFDRLTVEKYGEITKVKCITYKTLLEKHSIKNVDVIKIDAEGHDYEIFKQINLKNNGLKVIRLEWINLTDIEQEKIIETFNINKFKYEISGQDIVGISTDLYDEISNFTQSSDVKNYKINKLKNDVTIVTGIWDLKRDTLNEGWNRPFGHYLNNLEKLMKSPNNMIIFIEKKYEEFVWSHRTKENTFVIIKELDWFKNNGDIFDKIQKIRTNPDWYKQVGWLSESAQAKLEMYNPVVMSKIFLLNDATIMDPFDSSHLVWVDGGLTNTVHEGYFWHDKVIDKLDNYFNKFSFVCFPYDGKVEIHGFKYDKMCEYSNDEVNMVARGGIFGGPKHSINNINKIYYDLLVETLSEGYMGTEESLFTIMTYKHSDIINYFEIESNGLLGKFFEDLKGDRLDVKTNNKVLKLSNLDTNKVGLYVITFNSPNQFETLIKSMVDYDKNFIEKPKKFLLDNSTDLSTTPKYKELCEKYGFEHIKKDNIGIVGGRVFVAEHFEQTDLDFYFWFEDDMFFYPKKGELCKNGFNRYTEDLYQKTLEIMVKENFDFLKLNFTEFYGDNSIQWSWYNVPQDFRETNWPEKTKLPVHGLDPNAPKTKFNNIKSHRGVPYTDGEIYLCNWPIIFTRKGNETCYLETKWAHPFEQTLMSYSYQEMIKGRIKAGLLLMTPTEHDRFDHYDKELRKES